MLFITEDNEFKVQDGIQGIYFYATWMPFHKKMTLMISKVEEKHNNISFVGVDVDCFRSLTKRFDVKSVPIVLVLSNGSEKKRIEGLVMTSSFKAIFNDICSI